ncbi:hypothetical protein CVD28_00225 [Bacillus sp. M6-12]|nr:hypothetical protein CVD28_00225 [Bacillus sp. M6-12]
MDNSQKLNDEIKTQQEKIEKTKVEIEEAQKSFDAHQNIYSERLRSIQQQDQSSVLMYAEVLFSSKSLSDLISRANAISTILESDNALMDSLKEKQTELEEAKKKLDNQLNSLKEKQKELEVEQKTIEANKVEIHNQLKESEKNLEKQQNQLKEQVRQEAERVEKAERAERAERTQIAERVQREAELAQQLAQQSAVTFHAPKVQENFFDTSNISYSSDKASKVIEVAKQYMGVPYVWGGTTPSGFDCSGFTSYVFRNAVGIELPRVSRDQQDVGQQISPSQVQPGDLIFMGNPAYHVGIYIGGGKYIHAPRTGDVVKISSYNPSSFTTATRILN